MDTLAYYTEHAQEYAAATAAVDFRATQERFLKYLPRGSKILDFGCGSGRDSKYFAERGYVVEAVDGCAEFVELARAYAGVPVKQMLFAELNAVSEYEGIWACASILHLPMSELVDVWSKLALALKKGGYFYTSFKYGSFAGVRDGRYFTYLTEESLAELCRSAPDLAVVEQWVSTDVRQERAQEQWLNVIFRKG